ncbi:MreB/Mrl family cell shape determining protein, partial [Candidatus Saccharibacteria bacterium]|nr:MreB/Mrl family cell shape determining protein [Candidatus Saccharibacteria bacterium]
LGKGIVVREPSVVAIHSKSRDILAVGSDAQAMLGKTPASIAAVRPLRHGVISDFEVTERMLSYFIRKVHKSPTSLPRIPRPRVVVGIPSLVTEVEKRAVSDALRRAGARESFLIQEPMAAAVGAGLPVEEAKGSMVVDIGGGTTEIAVISLGGIIVGRSLKVAGDALDQAIVDYARKKYHLLLGERMAEDTKIKLGEATKGKRREGTVRGRDLKTGLPKTVAVSSHEIGEAIADPLAAIIASVKDVLEDAPPELVPDILDQGITLAGGVAQLRGIEKRFVRELGAPVNVAKDPITCVVRGTGVVLEKKELLKRISV